MVLSYESIDAVNNFSDHIAIKRMLDLKTDHGEIIDSDTVMVNRPVWHKSTEADLFNYTNTLNEHRAAIDIHRHVLDCSSLNLSEHSEDIDSFYEKIMQALVMQ